MEYLQLIGQLLIEQWKWVALVGLFLLGIWFRDATSAAPAQQTGLARR